MANRTDIGQIVRQIGKCRSVLDLDQLVSQFIETVPENNVTVKSNRKMTWVSDDASMLAVTLVAEYTSLWRQEHPNEPLRNAYADFFQKYGKHGGLTAAAIFTMAVHGDELKKEDIQYLADYLKREFGGQNE